MEPEKIILAEGERPFISKRKRGSIQESDYDFAAVNEKHVDKYRVSMKSYVENKSTHQFI